MEEIEMTDDVYVIILSNGRAENVPPSYNWYDILIQAESAWRHSCSSSAIPEKLIKNGKIIVEKQLWYVASNYVIEKNHLVDKAYEQAKEMFPEPKGE